MVHSYFDIDEKLPNFNEFRQETARNKYKGGIMKNEVEDRILTYILYAKMKKTLLPIENYPIQIKCIWHEKKPIRMDLDNRRASVKFILDAMQKARVIPNDNRKYVCGLFDEFVESDKDYVRVEIIEPPSKIVLREENLC